MLGAYSSERSFPAVKTFRLRVDVNMTPRTWGFDSRESRVWRSCVHKAVFMEFTGSRWRATIARVSSRTYDRERMFSVMVEKG